MKIFSFVNRRSKVARYVLEERLGGGFEAVSSFDAGQWPNAPTIDDVQDELQDGKYYRLMSENSEGVKSIIWTRPPGRKSAKTSTNTDLGKTIDDAIGPTITLATKFGELRTALEGAFGASPAPVEGNGLSHAQIDPLEQFTSEIERANKFYFAMAGLRGDKVSNLASLPPPVFNGAVPMWLHPQIITGAVNGATESLNQSAEQLGASFRKGFSAPKVAEKPIQAPSTLESSDPKLTELYKKLTTQKPHVEQIEPTIQDTNRAKLE